MSRVIMRAVIELTENLLIVLRCPARSQRGWSSASSVWICASRRLQKRVQTAPIVFER